jgi:hypothetical protein
MCLRLGFGECGQQEAGEKSGDSDHNQKLNQSKTRDLHWRCTFLLSRVTAGFRASDVGLLAHKDHSIQSS